MRARTIEIPYVLLEDMSEMRFAHEQDMIEAFPPHAPQQALTDRVRTWCPDRRPQHRDAAASRQRLEARPVLRVVVPDQKCRRSPKGRCLAQLLRDPGISWRPRDANVHDAP